jgi:tetratricopeptide (TPR) repeat protein
VRLPTSERSFTVWVVLSLLALVTLASPVAAKARRADSRVSKERQQARKLVKQGVVKLREGDYVTALDLFSRAFKVFPSPKIQFNIGQTYKELGRYLDAIGAYEKFFKDAAQDTSPALKKLARDNIQDLLRKIAIVTIQVSVDGATVSVDGKARGVSPLGAPLRLMPGSHSVVVKLTGYETVVVNLKLEANARLTRRITLQKPRPKVVNIIYKTVRKPKKGLPLVWTGIALTCAAGITAAVLGGLALKEQKRMDDLSLPLAERRDAQELGRRYQLSTDGLLIGTAVVAVATLVWYLAYVRPSGGSERVRVTPRGKAATVVPRLTPGGGGLTIEF